MFSIFSSCGCDVRFGISCLAIRTDSPILQPFKGIFLSKHDDSINSKELESGPSIHDFRFLHVFSNKITHTRPVQILAINSLKVNHDFAIQHGLSTHHGSIAKEATFFIPFEFNNIKGFSRCLYHSDSKILVSSFILEDFKGVQQHQK